MGRREDFRRRAERLGCKWIPFDSVGARPAPARPAPSRPVCMCGVGPEKSTKCCYGEGSAKFGRPIPFRP